MDHESHLLKVNVISIVLVFQSIWVFDLKTHCHLNHILKILTEKLIYIHNYKIKQLKQLVDVCVIKE